MPRLQPSNRVAVCRAFNIQKAPAVFGAVSAFVVLGCIILLSFAPFGAQICRSEDGLSSFDFLEDSACTALVGLWDGTVAVVDRRTPGMSPELLADIGFKVTRTVAVHPVDRQYFLAAGSVYVARGAPPLRAGGVRWALLCWLL